jgi:hypothetical protein
LLLLLLLVGTKRADASARKWPDKPPPSDDNVDDKQASKKNASTGKAKGGKHSIPHHLFKDEGAYKTSVQFAQAPP